MKKFFEDIVQYRSYIVYATKANLKAEVAGSYLNWLWWILDPFLFMMVYSFVSIIVFGKGEPYFPIFVFIGLNSWNFFSKCINKSVKVIRSFKGTISKVYIPKYVLIIVIMLENLFKMCVAFLLVFIMMPFYRVPLSAYIINSIPLFAVMIVFTFGCSCLVMHAGVYVADLAKFIKVFLRLIFYMSGIFYSIPKRIDEPFSSLILNLNPMAYLINGLRQSLLYSQTIDYRVLVAILAVGVVLSVVGIRTIIVNENNYVKVI